MDGVNEPSANPWWAFLMFVAISILTPTAPEHQPPLEQDSGNFYSFVPPLTVNGIPWWAFKIVLLSIVPFVMLMIVTKNMPKEFNVGHTGSEHSCWQWLFNMFYYRFSINEKKI
jgi:hypothetical protein